MPTWEEHLRQHGGRLTGADRVAEERARALAEDEVRVSHLLPAEPRLIGRVPRGRLRRADRMRGQQWTTMRRRQP